MRKLTTRQAAKAANVSFQVLYNWIGKGYIVPPPVQLVESRAVRLWSPKDIERIRAWKRKNFGKGVGRPRKDGAK